MRISEKKKEQLYEAIYRPIISKRVEAVRKPLTEEDLKDLDIHIWMNVRRVLGFEEFKNG